jgi:8-oxo-dGTP pyrophosphatase MutT (NUDIX family)
MRNATLLFMVKRSDGGEVTEVLLAMKKRGFGEGRYNGVGGKVNEGESIEDAARREAHEEVGVTVRDIRKVAELTFTFPHSQSWNQVVHAYICDSWVGEPAESEEMAPKWFATEDIPYFKMWPDDIFWLPQVLEGKLIKASFTFVEGDIVKDKSVETVGSF